MLLYRFLSVFGMVFLLACQSPTADTGEEREQTAANLPDAQPVRIKCIHRGDFYREILTDGKVGSRQSPMVFRTTGSIASVSVRNGQRVRRGDELTRLEPFEIDNRYRQALNSLEASRLQFEDMITSMGYNQTDTGNIPAKLLQSLRVKSGINKALDEYHFATFERDASVLHAPHDGLIAGIAYNQGEQAEPSNPFCFVIDDSQMHVTFPVLETETWMLRAGMSVVVSPVFADSIKFDAELIEINPVVEASGMVQCRAQCLNSRNLLTGMNVRVVIRDPVPRQLVVPREALVLRSGRQVVFTASNGLAKWNYVTTGLENKSYFTIVEGLKDGDSVIVAGNVNLAHDSKIYPENQ